jgi:hypothetical protein
MTANFFDGLISRILGQLLGPVPGNNEQTMIEEKGT